MIILDMFPIWAVFLGTVAVVLVALEHSTSGDLQRDGTRAFFERL